MPDAEKTVLVGTLHPLLAAAIMAGIAAATPTSLGTGTRETPMEKLIPSRLSQTLVTSIALMILERQLSR